MKVENIDTELGNQILLDLKIEGWKASKQYSRSAFDKGIDFDSYTMIKEGAELHFEWSNWFEWKITGSKQQLADLINRYDLTVT